MKKIKNLPLFKLQASKFLNVMILCPFCYSRVTYLELDTLEDEKYFNFLFISIPFSQYMKHSTSFSLSLLCFALHHNSV